MKETAERPRQAFWVHSRGLTITLSPDATANIGQAVANGSEIPTSESCRLKIITNDPIMEKRYPSSEDGKNFMNQMDYERREVLYAYTQELSSHIVTVWKSINPNKEIAILLYGSVAKGLVKKADNPSPSDIDLTVIGNFNDEERIKLRNKIQKKREEVKSKILEGCLQVTDDMWADIRYAGTLVQNVKKLTKNKHSAAINYIASGAQALYDPSNMWGKIEEEALEEYGRMSIKSKKSYQRKPNKKIVHATETQLIFPLKTNEIADIQINKLPDTNTHEEVVLWREITFTAIYTK